MSKKHDVYLTDLHFEHERWIKELLFWEDEIDTFKKRLEEVVVRWTDHDMKAAMEQYQNKFIMHNEIIDTLKHDIRKHESQLSHYAMAHPIAIDHVHFDDHVNLRERMDIQRNIYNEMKNDYYKFLTRAM
jgi:hypothetical protein